MQYQTETFDAVITEIQPLLQKHWEDVALNQDKVKLNPNWRAYQFLEREGALHITTARNKGRLVGYVIYLLSNWLHYKEEVLADGDIFWLDPDYRKGMTGVRLLKEAEQSLIARGVTAISNKVKLHKDVGRVFERLGYTPIERVYMKRVG